MLGKTWILTIEPLFAEKILNGKSRDSLGKWISSDFKGWRYIYVSLGDVDNARLLDFDKFAYVEKDNRFHYVDLNKSPFTFAFRPYLNGKVVARFWWDNGVSKFEILDEPVKLESITSNDFVGVLEN